MALFGLGTPELVVILVLFIVLFGATAIPRIARSLGQAKGSFAQAKREFEAEASKAERDAGARGASDAPAAEADVRRTARSLGIDDKGKSVEEVKELIARRLA